MIRNFGASGITSQPQGLDLGIGGSNIKSTQSGTFSVNQTSPYVVNISAVDMTKAVLFFTQTNKSGTNVKEIVMGKIISSTQIEFSCTNTGIYVDVAWEVVEFNNVKSLQRGDVFSSTSNSVNKTITSVNLNKSILITSFKTDSTSASMQQMFLMSYLSSATNVFASLYAGSNITVHYQVVEFN